MNIGRAILAWCGAAALAGAACAQGEWVLIGRDLEERRVELTRVEREEIWFVEEGGRAGSVGIERVLALVHARPAAERPPRELPWITRQRELRSPDGGALEADAFEGVLELVNGQRWVGTLVSARGESVSWLVEDAVVLEAPLESVRGAAIHGPIDAARASWDGLDDRVLLRNGDVVDGFVALLGASVVVEGAGETPIGLVSGVLLANPPGAASGTIVRTERGSVLSVGGLTVTATGRVRAEVRAGADADGATGGGELVITTGQVRSIGFAPGAYTALASIAPAAVETPGGLSPEPVRVHPDAALGVGAIELRGPVRVEWRLERGAARFAARAVLPPAAWAWGDCEVVVRTDDGREVQRERLYADRPEAELRAALGGATALTIEIERGRGGAVQDRVVLERAMVSWR